MKHVALLMIALAMSFTGAQNGVAYDCAADPENICGGGDPGAFAAAPEPAAPAPEEPTEDPAEDTEDPTDGTQDPEESTGIGD